MKTNKINAKAALAAAVAIVSLIGFNSFKKAETNLYKLVDNTYHRVDPLSGECREPLTETCLWEIESNELSMPKDQAPNAIAHAKGEFDGNLATEF